MESILNITEKTESQYKMDFAVAKRRLDDENDKLMELLAKKKFYLDRAVELRNAIVSPIEISGNDIAIENMDTRIANQQINIKKAEEALEIERQKLTKVNQERKMHEMLKEKAFEQFLMEEKQNEFLENDERSGFVYGQASMKEIGDE